MSVGTVLRFIGIVFRWLFDWAYFVLVVCFIGAMLGVASHMVYALVFVDTPDHGYFASFGFLNGLKYGSVWAGGLAIVLCVMRAHREYVQREKEASEL